MPPVATPDVQFRPILPELILVGTAVVVLLAVAFAGRAGRRGLLGVSLAGILAAAAAAVSLWDWGETHRGLTALGNTVTADRFAVVARLILLGIGFVGAVYGSHYFERSGEARGEFLPLLLLSLAGMTLLAAASDLIVVFLALEILSLALYVLAGFSFRLTAKEASMKYFLLGAFSSAFFLYGVAMAYGATGTTKIAGIAHALSGQTESPALALVAVGLLGVGFAFKVAAVPFHMWTPDVYQGAPTAVTAFMSAGTKVAAFSALIRVLDVGFHPLAWDWMPVVWALAALTVIVGSFLAVAQTDIKRMLAYSSIAHAGFILTGVTAADQSGIEAALFYLVAYAVMILGAFGVVMLVSVRGEDRTSLDSYSGLGRRRPLLAALMSLFLLSLAGVPPAAGFIAKVSVFGAAVGAGQWPLALIGVLASVVAAFFYLRVIVLMYMHEPRDDVVPEAAPVPTAMLLVPAVLTLLLGVLPQIVLGAIEKAAILRW